MNKWTHTETASAASVTASAAVNPRAVRVERVVFKWQFDASGDYSYLEPGCQGEEYDEQNAERLRAYHAGEWCFMGCTAIAEVSYPIGTGADRRLEWLSSGGLWGIESDSSEEYRREVEQQELEDLRQHLDVFGVDATELERAPQERKEA